jgi:polyphosphate kinase 2 (PPK2 family)
MKNLLIQLNRIADANEKRIAVILEGRDTAGKSSTIRAITEYLNPAWYSIVPSTKPSENVMRSWLKFWATKMPAKNQIVFYDRSWYSRAMVQKMNGWCTDKQYENFLNNHLEWEAGQIAGGVHFIKFWLSISESEQRTRIEARKNSPLTYWKFSENDENALSHYDRMSILKERVVSPDWNTIDYNDKKIGIENFLKVLLAECST